MKLAAVALAVSATSSFAGFTVTASMFSSSGGLDQWRVTAVNNGGDTGVQVKGLEYFYSGSPVAFEVTDNPDPNTGDDPNGIPDTVNLTSATRSRIRVNGVAANNVFVGVSPDNGFVEPNPYLNPVSAFQGAIANTSNTNATGVGFEIARLYIPTGGNGVFSGNIGGDVGSKVPFSVPIGGHVDPLFFIESVTPDPVNVVFGQIVTGGAPFSATVQVGGVPPGWGVQLIAGTLPSGVQIESITGGGTQSRTFVVTGRVDYSLNGMDVNVPILPQGGFVNEAGVIRLHITPEPTMLVWLSGLCVLSRGRKERP